VLKRRKEESKKEAARKKGRRKKNYLMEVSLAKQYRVSSGPQLLLAPGSELAHQEGHLLLLPVTGGCTRNLVAHVGVGVQNEEDVAFARL